MAQLQVRLRGDVQRVLTLDMPLLSIGRTPDNGLPLRDSTVAIRHAEVTVEGGNFLLTALAAEPHLTFVNGQRLTPHQPHRLVAGDEVKIGVFTLSYLEDEQPAAPPPPVRVGEVRTYGQPAARPAPPPLRPFPPPLPAAHAPALYAQFLPPIFEESLYLQRFLKIFQVMWEPLQGRQDHLHLHFAPPLAPVPVLHWLAQWLDVPLEDHWPEGRKREWMAEVISIYRWRGTRYGLTRALETVYGLSPRLTEDSGRPHILKIELPDSPDGEDSASREDITRFVYRHVPAHTRAEVVFLDAPTEPTAEKGGSAHD